MKKRVFFTILAIIVITSLLVGCANTNKEGSAQTPEEGSKVIKDIKDLKIGVSMGSLSQAKFQYAIDYWEQYAEDNGFEILVQPANDNVEKQISQCENLIMQGVDVLLVSALDMDAAAYIVDEAEKEGIPVISYNHFINNPKLKYYITMDGISVGEVQARSIVEKVPKGNYAILQGGPADLNAHLFYEGEMNILQPYIDKGDIKVVYEQAVDNWDPSKALQLMEDALTANDNDIQAVISPNDGIAGAVIQALEAQGLAGKVPVSGLDAELAACQRVVEGTQTQTTYLPLKIYNEAAMQFAIAVAMGEDPLEAVNSEYGTWTEPTDPAFGDLITFSVGVIAVDKDNMVETIIKDEFHSLEDIYTNIPKAQWPKVD